MTKPELAPVATAIVLEGEMERKRQGLDPDDTLFVRCPLGLILHARDLARLVESFDPNIVVM